MYNYPRPAWGYQPTPAELPPLPSLSTIALQDVVEGQQRATNGLVSLLSQERTSNERSTRDHKQQLANLTALSQNFLTFMPDVEQKFSALEGSIRSNCPNNDNTELQNRIKDMVEVVANLGRIAEGFACSTSLRLVPGQAPSPWAWVPTNPQPLQQDCTSFSATFPHAPRMFPAAIPNSTRSSVFAHSTGPARSVHWPSDLDAPTTSWSTPWSSNPYSSTGTGPGPMYHPPCPPIPHFSYPASVQSSAPPSPLSSRLEPPSFPPPHVLFGSRTPSPSVPIIEPPHVPPAVTSPQPAPSETESVVGSMRRTHLSTITECRTPSSGVLTIPSFGRTPPSGSSPSTSSIDTFSTPSGLIVNPPVPRPELIVPNGPIPQAWHGTMYPSEPSSSPSSDDGFSIPSPPPRVEIPPPRSAETVRWSSLFPSAPVVVERPAPEGGSSCVTRVSSLVESNSSPMSSPGRSVISYVDSPKSSSLSEPMTPPSRANHPSKLITDTVDAPKKSDESAQSQNASTVVASALNTPSNSTLPRKPLAIQLVSFFFESVQRIFKVPASVDLSYNGFEVSFSTTSIPWDDASSDMLANNDGEHDHTFEIMPAPSNAALHRYIRDLARVRIDLGAMHANADEKAVALLELRVKAEQEATQNWMKRVCVAAGALSIGDPAFSPRK